MKIDADQIKVELINEIERSCCNLKMPLLVFNQSACSIDITLALLCLCCALLR